MTKTAALLTTVLLALTGCGGGDPAPQAQDAKSTSSSPAPSDSPSASPTPSGPSELDVGQTYEGTGATLAVLKVGDQPAPSYLDPPDSLTTPVLVKVCRTTGAGGDELDTAGLDIIGVDNDSGQYAKLGSSWDEWPPAPQFPLGNHIVNPGECVKGWMLLNTPVRGKLKMVTAVDGYDGTTYAKWLVR